MMLLFIGPEAEFGRLEALKNQIGLTSENDRILLMGNTDVPKCWIRACDIFLSCSNFEGMPLSVLEAIGAGLPVILSQIPGHQTFRSLSHQFPLDHLDKGARMLENALQHVKVAKPSYYSGLWKAAEKFRREYSNDLMAEKYAKLYRK